MLSKPTNFYRSFFSTISILTLTFGVFTLSSIASVNTYAVTNTAIISSPTQDPDTSNNTASVSNNVTRDSDLAISVVINTNPIFPGAPVDYTFTITNNGLSSNSSVYVTGVLPSQFSTPTYTLPVGVTYDPVTGLVSGLSLNPGQSFTLNVNAVVKSTVETNVTGTGVVAPPTGTTDSVSTNNNAPYTFVITPIADLRLTKTSSGQFIAGNTVTYTLTGKNNGPSTAQPTITITDTLPANLSFVSFTNNTTPNLWNCTASGQIVTCSNTTAMLNNDQSSVDVRVKIASTAPAD